ncbi:tRNA (guanosine(46)-N7)-methyltransferase TrmB [Methylomarinum sp. Ch1-1]|uniref:tRNA (guanine-N(7)-)-methyltransferase n=1 Tax=Methylomarinum roseum TaxID=3067653 RepID=A0AAU7NWF0_9GAMM
MTRPERIEPNRIRSYIRRQGRATAGQRQALDNYWDKYCLDPQKNYDYEQVFARNAPVIVEIGFGNGESLAEMAEANPQLNYLGIEVHRPGVGHLMLLLEQKGLTNVRIYHHDAIEILEQKIPDHSLAGVHLFFPDPWHKRKHHKRRIVRPSFVELLIKKLHTGGYFHAATDWEHYAKDMLPILSAESGLINTSASNDFCPRPDYRPLTKFEKRGLRLGHGVWDLIFKKV